MKELYLLFLVAAFPLPIAAVFPFEAIGFSPAERQEARRASCAFVTLGVDEEAAALAAARSAWRSDVGSARRLRVDMAIGELPEDRMPPVMPDAPAFRPAVGDPVAYGGMPLPPSVAAPPPVRIPAEAPVVRSAEAFPREELLKID